MTTTNEVAEIANHQRWRQALAAYQDLVDCIDEVDGALQKSGQGDLANRLFGAQVAFMTKLVCLAPRDIVTEIARAELDLDTLMEGKNPLLEARS